jgi:hypothetical protein
MLLTMLTVLLVLVLLLVLVVLVVLRWQMLLLLLLTLVELRLNPPTRRWRGQYLAAAAGAAGSRAPIKPQHTSRLTGRC